MVFLLFVKRDCLGSALPAYYGDSTREQGFVNVWNGISSGDEAAR